MPGNTGTQDTPVSLPMDNSVPMADQTTTVPTSHAAFTVDSEVLAVANSKTANRTYVNGAAQNGTPATGDIVEWIETATVTSGNAVFNLTADRTSTGTAICSSVFSDSIQTQLVDPTAAYAQGVPVITSSKSISIPVTKQSFTGVVVATISVLGSVSFAAAPNGVVVKFRCVGIAA